MTGIILYPLICVALYYLGSQALITEFLWGRYPPKLDAFMSCPACTGFWFGLLCSGLGWWLQIPFLSLDPRHFATPLLVGLSAIVWRFQATSPVSACSATIEPRKEQQG